VKSFGFVVSDELEAPYIIDADDDEPSHLDDPLYQAISDTVDAQEREGTVCFCRNCRSCLNYEDAKWDYIYGLYEAVKAKRYGRRVQAA
jgi:hypothetical protein